MTNFFSLRRLLPALLLLPAAHVALAQGPGVGIGTTTPQASAALDVSSTTKGLLPPRMSQTQRDAINPAATAAGLTVFNTSTGVLNTWDGAKWVAALADTTPPPVTSVTFGFTAPGGAQTYTVPAGITALAVDMAGAAGGPFYFSGTGQGLGGRVQATLAVVPGQVLTIQVGGAGAAGAAGYNGGGAVPPIDGGGGGASDISIGGSRVLVAGGGGGGGDVGAGGAGGGLTGATGATDGNGGGGLGGSQSAPGAGGAAGVEPVGRSGNGATGGASGGYSGAGGGGYFGGGGGGGKAGGGGGSSYAGPGTSAVAHTQGFRSGSGYVTLTTGVPPANQPAPYLDGSNISGVIKNQTGQQAGASFNIAGNGTIGGTSTVTGNSTVGGSVGIGTTAPAQKLDVRTTDGSARIVVGTTANTGGGIALGNTGHGLQRGYPTLNADNNVGLYTTAGNLYLSANGTATNQLVLLNNGYVGIGTGTPGVPLDVTSTNSSYVVTNYYYLTYGGSGGPVGNSGNQSVSIRAAGRIVAPEFNATSDRRLKHVVGLSNAGADLGLLCRLRITDYTMRDRVQFGTRAFKKVIAQEVEEVFPQAVTSQTGFLPDIYALATAATALQDSLLTLTLPAGLPGPATAGQRLKLMGDRGEVLATLVRPAAAGARTLVLRGAAALAGGQVFVFGLEHADVRAVDYEALAMLNVSATQELARQLRALQARNAALEAKAAALEGRAAQTQADHASLLTLQAQLARLLGTDAQARK